MKNNFVLFICLVVLLSFSEVKAQVAKPAGPPKFEPINYGYEINWAAIATLANWYNLDFIKYYPKENSATKGEKIGYGVSLVSYLRNNNNFDDTFPSWKGFGAGAIYNIDSTYSYVGTHLLFDSYERYRDVGTLVQKRTGLRANIVMGGKEYLKPNLLVKFGWGVEVQSYKIEEFNELNKTTINNYYTTILNPFFEFKLAYLF